MKEQYHRQITTEALGSHLEGSALETLVAANLGQDLLRYQFGHDHFHYDNNSFIVADAYVAELRLNALTALQNGQVVASRQYFGRLTHTVQDFYAHSNYVFLWQARFPLAVEQEIEPETPEVLSHSSLRSGRLYYPLEAFSFIGIFRPLVLPFLPRDSHAWMNIDGPDRPGFALAYAAAVKRTLNEYLRLTQKMTVPQVALFTGHSHR